MYNCRQIEGPRVQILCAGHAKRQPPGSRQCAKRPVACANSPCEWSRSCLAVAKSRTQGPDPLRGARKTPNPEPRVPAQSQKCVTVAKSTPRIPARGSRMCQKASGLCRLIAKSLPCAHGSRAQGEFWRDSGGTRVRWIRRSPPDGF